MPNETSLCRIGFEPFYAGEDESRPLDSEGNELRIGCLYRGTDDNYYRIESVEPKEARAGWTVTCHQMRYVAARKRWEFFGSPKPKNPKLLSFHTCDI